MKKLLFAATLLFATNSFAGILIEPYLGYASETHNDKNGTSGNVTGMEYGGRLGFTFPLIFVAADVTTGSPKLKDNTSGSSANGTTRTLAADVGINSTLGFRAWVGYIFSGKLTDKINTTPDTFSGSGFKLGLGYKVALIPLSFNVEYILATYNKDTTNGTLTNKMDSKTVFVSVSFPLDL